MAATPCPAYRGLSQAQTSQARAGAAPPGKISDAVPVIPPGGGCRLTRPTGSSHRLKPRRPAQAQRPPGKISGTVPVSPGGGYALSGLQGPLTGSNLAGPPKRSAAGQDIRHGTCNFAGWRLSPYPAYRVLSQAHTSQARASAAPPGMGRFTSRLPDGYRTPPSPQPAPLR